MKSVQRCIALAQLLVEQNFPTIAIHRGMSQEERLSRYLFEVEVSYTILYIHYLAFADLKIRDDEQPLKNLRIL